MIILSFQKLGFESFLMSKILLISDTHGNLDLINDLVTTVNPNLVIHAGDFGFYDNQSLYRLSQRELRLLVKHSPFKDKYPVESTTPKKELIDIIQQHQLLGTFQDYLDKQKTFTVPVYAIWGNHDDAMVVKSLLKDRTIDNLHLLHSDNIVELPNLATKLMGIGGNFLVSKKLCRQPIAGQAGKIVSTLHEYGTLYKRLKNKSQPSIFVSHVSPGKEPLLSRLIIHFMPTFWISGHMGAPVTCIWNQFTIREMNESLDWFESQIDGFKDLIQGANLSEEAQIAADLILRPIPRSESWFKTLWNINLPDIGDGYAVLNIDGGRYSVETYSSEKWLPHMRI